MDKYKLPNDLPIGKSGDWEISTFEVTEKDVKRQLINFSGRYVSEGTYFKLTINNQIIMSDTPDEIRDHLWFIHQAKGKILIAGLGLGMVLNAVAQKPEVELITVIEKSKDVINLIGDFYNRKYPNVIINIINDDIFTWLPNHNIKYDYAWFDIWDNICTDNLEEMRILHNKFKYKAKIKKSWCKELLEYRKKKENKYF